MPAKIIPTRSAALERLEQFVPFAARYAGLRNFDLGSGKHDGVSRLSPYIRTRLVTEEECTQAVLRCHRARSVEKFLQEIAWRTYWKGWLEMRPEVWRHYIASLAELDRSDAYETAVSGNTGIDCFDHWVGELTGSGYLHNHARMWFASIWIFTLKLPWQQGAEFFLWHLLDGDAAANTLSWRWVAGLHTPGKHYLARASNIATFTNGRFNPVGQLDESAPPIVPDGCFEIQPLQLPPDPEPKGRVGHLMFPEDLAPPPESVGAVHSTAAFIPPVLNGSPLVEEFLAGAVTDTLERSGGVLLTGSLESSLIDWISAEKLDGVVISRPTAGLTRDFLQTQGLSIEPVHFVRGWDRQLWPLASSGFFKLKKGLPEIHKSIVNDPGFFELRAQERGS